MIDRVFLWEMSQIHRRELLELARVAPPGGRRHRRRHRRLRSPGNTSPSTVRFARRLLLWWPAAR